MSKILYRVTEKVAQISLYKNYSSLNKKITPPSIFSNRCENIFYNKLPRNWFGIEPTEKGVVNSHLISDDNESKTELFDFCSMVRIKGKNNSNSEIIDLSCANIITRNSDKIIKYYNKPFTSIIINNFEFKIIEEGDKLKFRTMIYIKSRSFNSKFFSTKVYIHFFSYNKKTGDFFIGRMEKLKKSKKFNKIIYKNNFKFLKRIFNKELYNSIAPFGTKPIINGLLQENIKIFNSLHLDKAHEIFSERILGKKIGKNNTFMTDIIDSFVKAKGIKVPNNYYELLCEWYPKMNQLHKSKMKLVQAILNMYGINSKIAIKLAHRETINIGHLILICKFFGPEHPQYLNNINWNKFDKIDKQKCYFTFSLINEIKNPNLSILKEKKIKKLFVQWLNNFLLDRLIISNSKTANYNYFIDVIDHIKLYQKIQENGVDIDIKALTYKKFQVEHMKFTKIMNIINNRKFYILDYNQEYIKHLELPIIIDDEIYIPFLLKNQNDYQEESNKVKHCVSSYISHSKSNIISLRNSKDARVTIEYNNDTCLPIQKRAIQNFDPPKEFNEAIKILDKRVLDYKNKPRLLEKRVELLDLEDIKELVFE